MPSLIPLDNVLGAFLIGLILSTLVYGITCLQLFLYFTDHCERDGLIVKGLVTAVWGLDTLHVALLSLGLYHYTVSNFGDYSALGVHWSLAVQVMIGSLLSLLVQSFFAYRVYVISKRRRAVPLFIILLSFAQTVFGTSYGCRVFAVTGFSDFGPITPFAPGALGADLLCDWSIAAAMIYHLYHSRSMVSSTNRIVNLLIKYTINTCLLEAICTVPCLVIWLVQMNSFTLVYAPFYFVLIRLYSCSLLCSLNNRDHLRGMNQRMEAITMSSAFQAAAASAGDRALHSSGEVSQSADETFQLHSHGKLETEIPAAQLAQDVLV
ncbi:unnamed protein product [Peniophora sp. CBMAI 1063]|nr:unnamed protein product [Peniophora sp. CBMAI 1063]